MSKTFEDIRRLLRQAIIRDIESHEVDGERLAFNRDVGRQWFHETEGEAVFAHLKATLEESLGALKQEGPSQERLLIHAASLRLDCLANMHGSHDPAAIFKEEFRLSPWYQSVKQVIDSAGELSDREFADMNTHLLLQEACYMLELTGFLQEEGAYRGPDSVETRLAAVEASNRKFRIAGVAMLVAIVAIVGVAFATARHWTKVDVPAHPQTFRSEVYKTGEFAITDSHLSPCTVGQSWTGCIDEMTDEYNNACASGSTGRWGNLARWAARARGSNRTCDAYTAEIERMKQASWGYVTTVGSFGHLTRTPVTATRKVSNKDHRSAVTHEAVCYLGFIGECR